MRVTDFSAAVKEKYPEYADIDDYVLAKAVVDKYPDDDELIRTFGGIPSLQSSDVLPQAEPAASTLVQTTASEDRSIGAGDDPQVVAQGIFEGAQPVTDLGTAEPVTVKPYDDEIDVAPRRKIPYAPGYKTIAAFTPAGEIGLPEEAPVTPGPTGTMVRAAGSEMVRKGKEMADVDLSEEKRRVEQLSSGREIADVYGINASGVNPQNVANHIRKAAKDLRGQGVKQDQIEDVSSFLLYESKKARKKRGEKMVETGEKAFAFAEGIDPTDRKAKKLLDKLVEIEDKRPGLGKAFSRGGLTTGIDHLAVDAYLSMNDEVVSKLIEMRARASETAKDDDIEGASNTLTATAEMLPAMGESIALSLIPVVGPALATGYWTKQGTGSVMLDLADKGVPRDIALPISVNTGIVYGLLGELGTLSGMGKVPFSELKNAVAKKITSEALKRVSKVGTERSMAWLSETLTEVPQEIVTYMAGELARRDMGEDVDWGQVRENVKATATETFKQVWGPMAITTGVFGIPGSVRTMIEQTGEGQVDVEYDPEDEADIETIKRKGEAVKGLGSKTGAEVMRRREIEVFHEAQNFADDVKKKMGKDATPLKIKVADSFVHEGRRQQLPGAGVFLQGEDAHEIVISPSVAPHNVGEVLAHEFTHYAAYESGEEVYRNAQEAYDEYKKTDEYKEKVQEYKEDIKLMEELVRSRNEGNENTEGVEKAVEDAKDRVIFKEFVADAGAEFLTDESGKGDLARLGSQIHDWIKGIMGDKQARTRNVMRGLIKSLRDKKPADIDQTGSADHMRKKKPDDVEQPELADTEYLGDEKDIATLKAVAKEAIPEGVPSERQRPGLKIGDKDKRPGISLRLPDLDTNIELDVGDDKQEILRKREIKYQQYADIEERAKSEGSDKGVDKPSNIDYINKRADLAKEMSKVTGRDAKAIEDGLRSASDESVDAIEKTVSAWRDKAHKDRLTGLNNREYLKDEGIANEDGGIDRPTAIFDIDHFKGVNDTYGHGKGDDVLKAFGGILSNTFGNDASVVRLGGEEFAIIPNEGVTAESLAPKIEVAREALKEVDFGDGLTGITFSAGIGENIEEADKQLYKAKDSGRQQTFIRGERYADEVRKAPEGKSKPRAEGRAQSRSERVVPEGDQEGAQRQDLSDGGEAPQHMRRVRGKVQPHVTKAGKVTVAPPSVAKIEDMKKLRGHIRKLYNEGEPAKGWYEESSQVIKDISGGDEEYAERLASVLAYLSPQNGVAENASQAMEAFRRWQSADARGDTDVDLKLGRYPNKNEPPLIAYMSGDITSNELLKGRKVRNFRNNLLVEVDPAIDQGATIDVWMTRAFGYLKDTPTDAQYTLMEEMVRDLADEKGVEIQQVQAAVWTAAKTKWEAKAPAIVSRGKKQGKIEYVRNKKGNLEMSPESNRWFQSQMFNVIKRSGDRVDAGGSFKDFITTQSGQLSWEATPSSQVDLLPGIHDAPYDERLQFHHAIMQAINDENGQSEILKAVGLPEVGEYVLPGSWQYKSNPSSQVIAPMMFNQGVDKGTKNQLNAAASMYGYFLRQDGVGWHMPLPGRSKRAANGIWVKLGRDVTPAEMEALERAVRKPEEKIGVIPTPGGVRIVRFEGDNQTPWYKGAEEIISNTVSGDISIGRFFSEGDMPEHENWKGRPHGQDYISEARAAGFPDLQRRLDGILSPKISAVVESYRDRWGGPAYSRKRAVPVVEGGVREGQERAGFAAEAEGLEGRGRVRADYERSDDQRKDGPDKRDTFLKSNKFFASVTEGRRGTPNWRGYSPVINLGQPAKALQDTRKKYIGNFDRHIATSIPGYFEVQPAVADAIVKSLGSGRVVDIGASEGSWGKAISSASDGKIQTVSVDPNNSMEQTFMDQPQAPGATFVNAPFGEGWTDPDGTVVEPFSPGEKFDYAHEGMTFQFISNDRGTHIGQVKEVLKPDGVALFEEKFYRESDDDAQWAENEAKKDLFKDQYYDEKELAEKSEEVLVGMHKNQVSAEQFENMLRDNFGHVAQYWDSGNFKGYAASDSKENLEKFTGSLSDLNSEFSTVKTPVDISQPTYLRNLRKWKSDLIAAIEAIPQEKGVADVVKGMIKKGRLKQSEIDALGLSEYLEKNPDTTKTSLLNQLHENKKNLRIGTVDKRSGIRLLEAWADDQGFEVDYVNDNTLAITSEHMIDDDDYQTMTDFQGTLEDALEWANIDEDRDYAALHEDYVAPGKYENYSETLLTAEGPYSYTPPEIHWVEGDVIVHIRTTERKHYPNIVDIASRIAKAVGAKSSASVGSGGPDVAVRKGAVTEAEAEHYARARGFDGKAIVSNVLNVEEVQSDWAKELREHKLFDKKKAESLRKIEKAEEDLKDYRDKMRDKYGDDWHKKMNREEFEIDADLYARSEMATRDDMRLKDKVVEDFPFANNWMELGVKRALADGADKEYVSFPNSKTVQDMYGLDITGIKYNPETNELTAIRVGQDTPINVTVPESELPKYIGKDLTEKLLAKDNKNLTEEEIKDSPPPEWAVNLYDKKLPTWTKKYVKKQFGAETTTIDLGNGPQFTVVVNDRMRDMDGQPMFQRKTMTEERTAPVRWVPMETYKGYLTRKVVEKFSRLEEIQKYIPPANEAQDAMLQQTIMHGKVASQVDDINRTIVDPLVKRIHSYGIPMHDLETYLYARHAQERNEAIAEINPDMSSGSGMSDADAENILQQVRESGKQAQYDRLAEMVYDINRRTRKILSDAGNISEETLAAWENYENYVPLRGISLYEDDDYVVEHEKALKKYKGDAQKAERDLDQRGIYPTKYVSSTRGGGIGRGFSIRGPESKRALGRRSMAENIIANSITQLSDAIVRAEKNRVGQSFLDYATQNQGVKTRIKENGKYRTVNLWDVDTPQMTRRLNPVTGEVEEVVDTKIDDNVMVVKRDGVEHHIRINDPALARAMVNLGADRANKILQMSAQWNRYIAAINTQLNPEFVLTNLTRDVQTAIANVGGLEGLDNAEAAKAVIKTIRGIPGSIKGAYRAQGGDMRGGWAKWYKEFDEAGGRIGFFGLNEVDDIQKRLIKSVEMLEPGNVTSIKRMYRSAGDYVSRLNSAVENASRLSVYRAMREMGVSKAKSAAIAKGITVNFNKKGELGTMVNALYVFSNASIQGNIRMLQAMRNPRVQAIAGAAVVGSLAMAQLSRMVMGDDDDEMNHYDKIPAWEKAHNFIIPMTNGRYAKIPLPYGYNLFWAIGQAIDHGVHNRRKLADATKGLLTTAAATFSPIGSASTLLQTVTPTAGRLMVDLGLNKNFIGRDIWLEQKFGPEKSRAHSAKATTPDVYTKPLQALNELTGGSEYRHGLLDISPEGVEYVYEYMTGGVGKTIERSVNLLNNAVSKKAPAPRNVPIVRRYYGEIESWYDQSLMYDRLVELKRIRAEYDNLVANGERKKAEAFGKRNRQALIMTRKPSKGRSIVSGIESKIREQKKRRRAAYEHNDMDAVKNIDENIEKLTDNLNRQYNKRILGSSEE